MMFSTSSVPNALRVFVIVVFLCLTGLAKSNAGMVNLITNGDFEAGNTGFQSGYTYITSGIINAGQYAITRDARDHSAIQGFSGDHTTGQGLMMMVDSSWLPSGQAPLMVWSQTVNVDAQSVYTFSGWIASWTLAPDLWPSIVEARVNGNLIGAITAPGHPSLGGNQGGIGAWIDFSFEWQSLSATTALLELYEVGGVDYGQNSFLGGHDFAIDDLSFSAVPEPTSITLIGLAGIVCAGFRRKRQ